MKKVLVFLQKLLNLAVLPLTILNGIFMLLGILAPFINPNTFWILQIFGLAFPIFFIINLFFLIYWWSQLKMAFLIPLCLFVFNLYFASKYIQFSASRKVPENHIKMTSLNCQLFGFWDGDEKYFYSKAVQTFKEENADILCLQEFYVKGQVGEYLSAIKKNCNFKEYSYFPLNDKKNYGMVIFSKYKIVATDRIRFNQETGNMAMYIDVVNGEDTVRVLNIHLQSNRFSKNDLKYVRQLQKDMHPDLDNSKRLLGQMQIAYKKRAAQADTIHNNIQASPYPVLVAGDVNDVPASYAYNQVAKNLNDAFRERGSGLESTYHGMLSFFRIDYLFSSRSIPVYAYSSHRKIPSDHKMVSGIFGWPMKKEH